VRSVLVVTAGCAVTAACAMCLWAATNTSRNIGVEAFPGEVEHPETALPSDANEKTEWAFARLRYIGYGRRGSGQLFYRSWGTDSPKADRQFVAGVRRLTRVHTRSVEEVVNLDSDEIYNWPWIYAVEVGHWYLTDAQCKKLRDYLQRGGFLMTDDFHGTREWSVFTESMERVFPDRPIVEIEDRDPIMHVIYDLDNKIQVPGKQYLYSGHLYEYDGYIPRWRGIYDDKGRIMVAMCHNQDNGDAWEWADDPRYGEKYASQAYRMGINYVVYSMTH
jgi:hypothetical protein